MKNYIIILLVLFSCSLFGQDVVVLDQDLNGRYGKYSAIDAVALPNGKYVLPARVLNDPDLAAAVDLINSHTESESEILDLPESGTVVKDKIYKWTGREDLSPLVVCIQTHERTIYDPDETPALFSFFRENADDLNWIPNEWVEVGWKRIYEGTTYVCLQAHQTLETWTPPNTPALWQAESGGGEYPVWVQPTGAHDSYNIGDIVWYPTEGSTLYESLINANVWSPIIYPQGWREYTP